MYNVDYYEEKEVASLDHSQHKAPPTQIMEGKGEENYWIGTRNL